MLFHLDQYILSYIISIIIIFTIYNEINIYIFDQMYIKLMYKFFYITSQKCGLFFTLPLCLNGWD